MKEETTFGNLNLYAFSKETNSYRNLAFFFGVDFETSNNSVTMDSTIVIEVVDEV